jgi:hypothetical protein
MGQVRRGFWLREAESRLGAGGASNSVRRTDCNPVPMCVAKWGYVG